MSSILQPFNLIGKAARAFFKADLRLRRGERGFEVVLDDAAAKAAADAKRTRATDSLRPDGVQQREDRALNQVRQSLAALLDELPENRSTLRHLAFIEHALGKKGLRALYKVPYDVLKRALDQFEGLVVNWSDEGLATLRSKMAVALIERESEAAAPAPPPGDSPSSIDSAPLALPVELAGDDAAEAEAALLAAYGSVVMPELQLAPTDDEHRVEIQGELNSPSGKALAKAVRRGDGLQQPESRQPEPQV